MEKDSKLLNLAKKKTTTVKNVGTKRVKNVKPKNVVGKNVKSTPKERELKAKQKVEELLQDIPLTLDKKNDDLLVIETNEKKIGVEWLEEQISQLLLENEKLKNDYSELYNENQNLKNQDLNGENFVKTKVIELFDEIQTNHIKLGIDPQTGIGNFRIYCPGFLNRLLMFFPFLNEFKKY